MLPISALADVTRREERSSRVLNRDYGVYNLVVMGTRCSKLTGLGGWSGMNAPVDFIVYFAISLKEV